MANLYPFQAAQTRLAREASYGVTPGSPAWLRLNAMGIVPGTTFEIDAFTPRGSLVPTISLLNDEFATGSLEGRLDYNSLGYVFSGLFGPPSITSLGSGAYQWVWAWDGRRPNRPVSFTAHFGFPGPAEADAITGMLFNSLSISGGRADGFDVSGDVFGKKPTVGSALGGITNEVQTVTVTGTPTGGTFTLTLNGETTAPIAYNAAPAAVETALVALPTIQPGDIVVGGTALPAGGVTVTFSGYYFSGQNVNAMTANSALLTGGTTPTVVITQTTPGADAVTDIQPVPAGAVQGDLYLDTSWAALGTSQLLYAFDMSYDIGERMSRVRPMNSSFSSDDVIDTADQEHMLMLNFGVNATERALFSRIRAGQRSYARVAWTGDVIGGAIPYSLKLDSTLLWQEVGEPDETDNVMTRQWTGRIASDAASNKALEITLVNGISGLL